MNDYPTEEELNRMIEELEREQLYAPKHLKEDILFKARKIEKRRNKNVQPVSFRMYTLKMAVGMAAAVLLVFMSPAESGNGFEGIGMTEGRWKALEERNLSEEKDRVSLDERIMARMDEKREEAGKLFEKVGNLFRREDLGGNDYEN